MCGRYSFFIPLEQASQVLGVGVAPHADWYAHYNAAPSQGMPVITNEFPEIIQFFRWGLVPRWAKDISIGYKMINTRAESIVEKPAFRNIFKYKRCLVLADGYYEWQVPNTPGNSPMPKGKQVKQPFRFHLPGDEIMLLAGLWDTWGTENLQTFSIITCAANKDVAPYHDRMPVILNRHQAAQWLHTKTDTQALLEMLAPAPEGLLSIYPISTYLNKPGNEGPEVITPLL